MADDLPPETLARLERLRAATGAGPRQLTGMVDLGAGPEAVFAAVSEIDRMRRWMAGMEGGAYDGRAPGAALTAGMTRSLSFGPVADEERIVAVEAPGLFAYSIIGGMPIRNHLAVIEIEALTDGSRLTWHQCFAAAPLIGAFRRRRVRSFAHTSLAALSARMGGGAPRFC